LAGGLKVRTDTSEFETVEETVEKSDVERIIEMGKSKSRAESRVES